MKKEEDEDESISQASGQQVCSENVKVWAPGEGPYLSIDVSEEEEKVNDDLGKGREMQISNSFRGTQVPNLDFFFLDAGSYLYSFGT